MVSDTIITIERLPDHYTWQEVKDIARHKTTRVVRVNTAYRTNSIGVLETVHLVTVSSSSEGTNLYEWLVSTRLESGQPIVHMFWNSVCQRRNCYLIVDCCKTCQDSTAVGARQTQTIPPLPQYLVSGPSYGSQSVPLSPSGLSYVTTAGQHVNPSFSSVSTVQTASMGSSEVISPISFALHQRAGHSGDHGAASSLQHTSAPTSVQAQYGLRPMIAMQAPWRPTVNAVQGLVATESRGIFVRNIDFKAGPDDVKQFFSRAGEVQSCTMGRRGNKQWGGTAAIQYSSTAEATTAIRTLDLFRWRGRTIRVRRDKEFVPAQTDCEQQQTGPEITNPAGASSACSSTEYPIIAKGTMPLKQDSPAETQQHTGAGSV